jgi:ADP-ribose pyrophosphatase
VKVNRSELIYRGIVFSVRRDEISMPDGTVSIREVADHPDAIAVVAVDADGLLLLERQYRYPARQELLEIPAGSIEPGEDPEEAVRREMQEETGFLPQKVERLSGFYSAPGWATEYLYLYLATELVPSRLIAEDTGEISLERVPPDRVLELIRSGEIEDSKTIAGLLLYLWLKKG